MCISCADDTINIILCIIGCVFFFQAEDGIRDLVRSRGLGDVYKRQLIAESKKGVLVIIQEGEKKESVLDKIKLYENKETCLLYTSDAADERSSVDLGGRRIIKKKKKGKIVECRMNTITNRNII